MRLKKRGTESDDRPSSLLASMARAPLCRTLLGPPADATLSLYPVQAHADLWSRYLNRHGEEL